jgi:putative sigma-54 modulation protein
VKIQVRAVTIELDARTREEIEAIVRTALGRHERRIARAAVRVADLNGPRGGRDLSCLIDVSMRPRGRLYIEETDVDLRGAVGQAAEAASVAVTRSLERIRDRHRRTGGVRAAFGASGA